MRSRIRRGDRGAFLIIFVLCLAAVLMIVALVVDLGFARSSKRDEQQLADLAALSAGRQMAGYGATSGGSVVGRPRDACAAAMKSIRTNAGDFAPTDAQISDGSAGACDALPQVTSGCNEATSLPVNASLGPIGGYVVTVRYPIPASDLVDSAFSGGVGVDDGTKQCERIAITVQRTDSTAFAPVLGGAESLDTSQSVVVRAALDADNSVVPAFLMLERTSCAVLTNSANGVGSTGIAVYNIGNNQPGTIHVDSSASSGCTGNSANSVAVYGTPLSSGGPSIRLFPTDDGSADGLLYVVATANAAKSVPTGVNAVPQPADVVSRAPVDDEFNDTDNPAVATLHSAARTALSTTVNADVSGDSWRRLGCNLAPLSATDTDTANWYVRCDTFTPTGTLISARAAAFGVAPTRILFDGDVSVPNGGTLTLVNPTGTISDFVVKGKLSVAGTLALGSNVRRVYVGGRDDWPSNNNASAVDVGNSGSVLIRSTTLPTAASPTVCPIAATGSETSRAELSIFGDDAPNLTSSGSMALCNTTMYLAGDTLGTSYAKQQVTSGGNCSTELPCPRTSSNAASAGLFVFQGPSGKYIDWTAPNETAAKKASPRGVEDLLFWGEGSGLSSVKSGAQMVTQGVFVAPSMAVQFQSPATGAPRNAQFIARTLELLQGTLDMKPLPSDSTSIPAPGSFTIIR